MTATPAGAAAAARDGGPAPSAADILLEVGVEELPASYVEPALAHLERALAEGVREHRLGAGETETYATPRRLAVLLHGVARRQSDSEEEVSGPPVAAAYDDAGEPTQALLGFARGKGVDLADVRRVTTEKGEYVAATVRHEGKPAAEILPAIVERALAGTPFPKSMRWPQAPGFRFARPVRWLVVLHGADVIPVLAAGVQSGRTTSGHRFFHARPVEISEPSAYLAQLRKASVVADHRKRGKSLSSAARRLAREAGGRLIEDPELVDLNNFLVERPQVFLGRFDPVYLDLPREVVVSALREHQYYFAVEDREEKLLPVFVGVRNGLKRNLDGVAHGNEFVLRARLEDARFYWETDLRRAPADRVEELAGITWLEDLGTLLDKARRVERLVTWTAAQWAPEHEDHARRAALLMKTDLLSEMIGSGKEYAKLEGLIGSYYAERHGERPEVVQAIRDHGKPKGASDALPATDAGSALAAADRLDTIAGSFLAGKIPTGSEDPYGVRRAGNGVVRLLLEQERHLDLWTASERALSHFGEGGAPSAPGNVAPLAPELLRALSEFWRGRVETALADRELAYDEIAAVLEAEHGWTDPLDALHRARALHKTRRKASFRELVIGFKRAANIVRAETDAPASAAESPGGASWGHPAEAKLARALERARAEAAPHFERRDYEKVLAVLLGMRSAIDAFFDGVLVNDPNDPSARLRRLGLLNEVRSLFVRGFDLSRVVVEG